MDRLLDLSSAVSEEYVRLLDETLRVFYQPTSASRGKAQEILVQLQKNPQAWTRVAYILTNSQQSSTKFYALQVLNDTIKTRWKVLPPNERQGVKDYLVKKIIDLTKDEESLQKERQFTRKMNETLIAVLKNEWPHNWPTFIEELVNSSKASESLCENNIHILKLLSEEIFDFSQDQLTSKKTKRLKDQLCEEFSKIYQLCEVVLQRSQRASLLTVTLQTLLRFLSWVPLGYVFETKLIETLVVKFFPEQTFRNDTLACLTEIGSLKGLPADRYDDMLRNLFSYFMKQLEQLLPPDTDIAAAYNRGSEEDKNLVQGLAMFITSFLNEHISLLEKGPYADPLLKALGCLVQISMVDDTEIFKICVEYWNSLSKTVYMDKIKSATDPGVILHLDGGNPDYRCRMYKDLFAKVRLVIIVKMAKPEEVLIEQDERGEIVRQATRDTDAIALYKTMKETLVYLTHLDHESTELIMLDKLSRQVDGEEWSWNNLNRLCWAIGSISLTMSEQHVCFIFFQFRIYFFQKILYLTNLSFFVEIFSKIHEKRFLVTVIKDLLGLCEAKRGKDNKAVIASNIMYVVGQYPRFLKAHWRFLKTVVNKLFEFMHETHPGVQDMACDTFLKISRKCRKKFVERQPAERMAYIEELVANLPSIISSLETHQEHVFYEAVGYMVAAEQNQERRKELLLKTMERPNADWKRAMDDAGKNVESLKAPEQIKLISKTIRTNISVCRSVGQPFIAQVGIIYNDMLNVYKVYSQHVQGAVQQGGERATKTTEVRLMRAAKKEILQLIESFIGKATASNAAMVASHFLPPMLDNVLGDYHRSIKEARDPEVLSLLTTMVSTLQGEILSNVPTIMQAVFEVTLNMITTNFTDFPEIRKNFFALLKSIVKNAFPAIFQCPETYQRAVIDAIVGAFKHTERIVAEIGLDILLRFLNNVRADDGIAQGFYKSYLLVLCQEIFSVLTDKLHTPGFMKQCNILQYMYHLVENGNVTMPLYDSSNPTHVQVSPTPLPNNIFIKQYTVKMVTSIFPNVNAQKAQGFVVGLCDNSKESSELYTHVRDFLIHTNEWGEDDEDTLDREVARNQGIAAAQANKQHMMSVPGLLKPSELPDDMDDI